MCNIYNQQHPRMSRRSWIQIYSLAFVVKQCQICVWNSVLLKSKWFWCVCAIMPTLDSTSGTVNSICKYAMTTFPVNHVDLFAWGAFYLAFVWKLRLELRVSHYTPRADRVNDLSQGHNNGFIAEPYVWKLY